MSHNNIINLLILTAISINGCSAQQPVIGKQITDGKVVHKVSRVSYGKASWYGKRFEGKKTASGEPFRVSKKTAAHRLYPFGTELRVTNLTNNKSVIVRVNDRGPHSKERIIDLSQSAANEIGLITQGVAKVKVEIVNLDSKQQRVASLPTSRQRCETGDCKSTLVKSKSVRGNAKPFTKVAKTANPNRVSVYGEELLSKAPNKDYRSNSNMQVANQARAYTPTRVAQSYPKVASYNRNNFVQIGAFRNQDGATICASRYSLLSKKYKAVIKNGTLNQKTIYRVQIEGFASESEARIFISKHRSSLSGAFLVRR